MPSIPRTLAIVVLAIGPLRAAQGQSADTLPSGSRDARSRSWLVAAGVEPFAFDLRTREPGAKGTLHGSLARVWGDVPRGFRAQFTLAADLPQGIAAASASCPACQVDSERYSLQAAFLASRPFAQRGGMATYLVGGPLVEFEAAHQDFKGGTFTVENLRNVPVVPAHSSWSVGATAGLGLSVPLTRTTRLYAEQHVMVPALLGGYYGSRGKVRYPLSVGVQIR